MTISVNIFIVLLSVISAGANSDGELFNDDLSESLERSTGFPCPNPDDISPCVCVYQNDELYLDCTAVTSEQELAEVFTKEFPVVEFQDFLLNSSTLTSLDLDTNGISFKRMAFFPGPNSITSIGEEFLSASLNTLTDFLMLGSKLTTDGFPFDLISSMPNLHQFFLEDTELTSIPALISDSLRDIRITSSTINELEPETFDDCPGFWNIYLQNNQLSTLRTGTFPVHRETVRINLINNDIETIEPSTFYSDNVTVARLNFLYLNENQITNLGRYSIPLTSSMFTVGLNANRISTISEDAFFLLSEPEPNSITLSLTGNELSEVSETVFQPIMQYISDLNLVGNPLNCGCDIAWLLLNTVYLNKLNPSTTCYDGIPVHDLDPQVYLDNC